MSWTALNMSTFDTLKNSEIKIFDDKTMNHFVFGSFSGASSMTIVYPLDLMRRRL